MSEAVKGLWNTGEVSMYGVFEAKFNTKKAEEMIKALKELVGSRSIVRVASVSGDIVRVELVDGKVIEVPLRDVPFFMGNIFSKIAYVVGKISWNHLVTKRMIVMSEVGREVSVEKIKMSSEIEVEVEEAVSIMDAILSVVKGVQV